MSLSLKVRRDQFRRENFDPEDLEFRIRYPDQGIYWDDYRTWGLSDLCAVRDELGKDERVLSVEMVRIAARLKTDHSQQGETVLRIRLLRYAEIKERRAAVLAMIEQRKHIPEALETEVSSESRKDEPEELDDGAHTRLTKILSDYDIEEPPDLAKLFSQSAAYRVDWLCKRNLPDEKKWELLDKISSCTERTNPYKDMPSMKSAVSQKLRRERLK